MVLLVRKKTSQRNPSTGVRSVSENRVAWFNLPPGFLFHVLSKLSILCGLRIYEVDNSTNHAIASGNKADWWASICLLAQLKKLINLRNNPEGRTEKENWIDRAKGTTERRPQLVWEIFGSLDKLSKKTNTYNALHNILDLFNECARNALFPEEIKEQVSRYCQEVVAHDGAYPRVRQMAHQVPYILSEGRNAPLDFLAPGLGMSNVKVYGSTHIIYYDQRTTAEDVIDQIAWLTGMRSTATFGLFRRNGAEETMIDRKTKADWTIGGDLIFKKALFPVNDDLTDPVERGMAINQALEEFREKSCLWSCELDCITDVIGSYLEVTQDLQNRDIRDEIQRVLDQILPRLPEELRQVELDKWIEKVGNCLEKPQISDPALKFIDYMKKLPYSFQLEFIVSCVHSELSLPTKLPIRMHINRHGVRFSSLEDGEDLCETVQIGQIEEEDLTSDSLTIVHQNHIELRTKIASPQASLIADILNFYMKDFADSRPRTIESDTDNDARNWSSRTDESNPGYTADEDPSDEEGSGSEGHITDARAGQNPTGRRAGTKNGAGESSSSKKESVPMSFGQGMVRYQQWKEYSMNSIKPHSSPPPVNINIGDFFDKNREYCVIGRLDSGFVYMARHDRTGQHFLLNSYSTEEALQSTLNVLNRLEGARYAPKLKEVARIGSETHWTVIAVGETTLEILLTNQSLSPVDKRQILAQILRGIEEAHSRGVTFSDMQPSDFTFMASEHAWIFSSLKNLAEVGAAAGIVLSDSTPPEMWSSIKNGAPVTTTMEADMWLVGALAFRILTGRRLFGFNPPLGVIKQSLESEELPGMQEIEDGAPYKGLLEMLLVFDPTCRASASQALKSEFFSIR